MLLLFEGTNERLIYFWPLAAAGRCRVRSVAAKGWGESKPTGQKSVNTDRKTRGTDESFLLKKTQWLLNTDTLCFLRISFKPLRRLIHHLPLLGACGFTEEDKHIRNDFPSIARFAGEKLRPPPALWNEAIQQIFPLNLTRSHNVLNAVKELPMSLVMVSLFFYHCSNGSKWICFIVSEWRGKCLSFVFKKKRQNKNSFSEVDHGTSSFTSPIEMSQRLLKNILIVATQMTA